MSGNCVIARTGSAGMMRPAADAGFSAVDEAADPISLVRYLDRVSGHLGEAKRRIREQLEVVEGNVVLDVGCGTGDDARGLSAVVGPSGRIIGLDASMTMVEEARRRAAGFTVLVEFGIGNAQTLPFAAASFDACRADRGIPAVPVRRPSRDLCDADVHNTRPPRNHRRAPTGRDAAARGTGEGHHSHRQVPLAGRAGRVRLLRRGGDLLPREGNQSAPSTSLTGEPRRYHSRGKHALYQRPAFDPGLAEDPPFVRRPTMTMNTIERPVSSRALDAATLCEAFQISAATHPQRVALRTSGDAAVVSWEQYAERVRRTAAGLAALGVRRGDTVALMLTNRPEFHWVDVAAMYLGATTFGVYNTFAQQQVEYVLRDADCAVVVTEQAFAETLRRARRACPRLAHVVPVDGGEGMLSLDDVDASGDPDFELTPTWPAPRGSGSKSTRASRPPSPPNRRTSAGKPCRPRSTPGCGWCEPSKPASRPPRSCWPSMRGPTRSCCPVCGRVWDWTASKPQ